MYLISKIIEPTQFALREGFELSSGNIHQSTAFIKMVTLKVSHLPQKLFQGLI